MKQPFGVILAGGLATRMGGGDKASLMLGGQSLLSHAVERLEPQVAGLALNANGDPARFAATGLRVLSDPLSGHPGPLAGILAGLDWAAAEGGDTVVSVACDTPFFPCDLVPQLLLAAEGMGAPLALAASRGRRHPVFGLWPVSLRGALRAALERGERKVAAFAEAHGGREAAFPAPGLDPFFNINTPADLAEAEAVLA
ncbi:molybdenum cofactor guanylyltransferase MobA [Salipiger abyssi]|uniref:molybdenum cofactor guanylyltransferase MobA n=1 Tax=Salipiger abyssi TaxID=1250539 RepID=UPI001A8F1777|nr:molybdenum cofactor guanylyltransferase MobA [Salipiger abyssi]MBN9890062.1 molybdenum cofactor guanylyltransferase MobA [Salipiger abyssi]